VGLFSRKPVRGGDRSLTASAEVVDATKIDMQTTRKFRGSSEKQKRAWTHYDAVPEMWFAHNYISNALRRVRIYPAVQPEPGAAPLPLLPTDGAIGARANAELDRLRDIDGTHGTIQHDMALQLCVPAEGLFAWFDDPDSNEETFGVYSMDELQVKDGKWTLLDNENATQGELLGGDGVDVADGGSVVVNRFWRPHPRFRKAPDSAFFPLRETLDELLILDRLYRSNARSRVPAGLLLAPEELMLASTSGQRRPKGRGGPGNSQLDPLVAAIINAIIQPLSDEESAANVAPPVIKAKGDLIEKFRHMTFGREFDSDTAARYDRVLKRAADGVDLPASIVTGAEDLNHWSLWQIDEDAFDAHMAPLVQLICSAVTQVFFKPAMADVQGPGTEKVFIWYDASDLMSHPNKAQDALAANKAIIISDAATRKYLGYDESDAPDEEERAEKIEREKAAKPGQPPSGGEQGPPPEPQRSAIVASISPINEVGLELARLDRDLRMQLQAVCEGAVVRALDKAGAKMRARVGDQEPYTVMLDGVPNGEVCRVLGRNVVNTFETDDDLIDDAALSVIPAYTRLVSRVQRHVRTTAAEYDADVDLEQLEAQQDADRQRGAEVLTASLIAAIAAMLYSPAIDAPIRGELDDTFSIPAGTIRDALSSAGGAPAPGAVTQTYARPQGGVATGETAMEILVRVGLTPDGWQWVYGDAPRKRSFLGHKELNGVEFLDWTDDALRVDPEDAWLHTDFYYPGDHKHCQCDFAPKMTEDDANDAGLEPQAVPSEA
jgi:hypothetical protein